MFTGIISHIGIFTGFRHGHQEIGVEAPGLAEKVSPGQSVAVDGVCLTVSSRERAVLVFDLSQETLAKTTLGGLRPRAALNLELPVTPATLLGGHLVSGHVDYKARMLKVTSRPPGKRMIISVPGEFRPFFIPKGSVAVNGVSLTIAELRRASFEVELIPATLRSTNLGNLRAGAEINVECDMIGKYMYNWLNREKR
jgi:riboflavin synthase